MLIDKVHVLLQAGDGGNGCESYYRRTDRKAVPNGGDGGKGGSVVIRSNNNAPALGNLRAKQHLIAESGGHGSSNRKRGRCGKDLVITVPLGTRIYDRNRKFLIRELKDTDMEVVILEGGKPGGGNQGGKKATFGEKGQALDVELTFRIPAEIFMVGLPNSGKSALLNKLTRSHAAETHYPFATKDPEIGVFETAAYQQRTLCELPSVYQSSHEGRGVGAGFLRHLEHAEIILYVLDPVSEFAGSLKEGLTTLRHEISLHDEAFLHKPSAIVITKQDLPEAQEAVKKQKFKSDLPCFYISVHQDQGLKELVDYLSQKREPSSHA